MISNMYSYFFVHTLHCMGFSVSSRKGGQGKMMRPYRVYRVQGVMLLFHMQEIVFVDSQEGLLSSRGGGGQTYWHQAYNYNSHHSLHYDTHISIHHCTNYTAVTNH